MCSPDIEVRVSRTLFVAQYPRRLIGLVLQAGIHQAARQVAGLEQIFGQTVLIDDYSAKWIRSDSVSKIQPL